jgi:putative MFS transporter
MAQKAVTLGDEGGENIQNAEEVRAIGARLDALPVTSFHHLLAFVIAAGLIVDSVDIAISASIAGALLHTRFTDMNGVAALAMATSLGLGLGGLAMGVLADRFGRATMMRYNMAVIAICGIGAALAATFEQLLAWRGLTAFALGGETILAYGMLTEFMPARLRGRWLAWVALLASVGLPLSMAMAYWIAPLEHGWRWLLAAPALAAMFIFVLRFALPESPLWLASRARSTAAQKIVEKLERGAAAAGKQAPIALSPASEDAARLYAATDRLREFISRFVVASAIHIGAMTAMFGFVSWLPAFFVSAGRDVADSALFSAVMTAGAPFGAAAALWLSDRFERKWMLMTGALGACVLGAGYAAAASDQMIMGLGFLTVVAIYFFATVGMFTYVPELFATRVRLRALGGVSAVGRGAAFLLPLLIAPLFAAASQAGVIAFVASVLAAQALLVWSFGPRTKARPLL